jgi:hypothetical protein
MLAKITFTGGAEITVDEDASDVRRRLSADRIAVLGGEHSRYATPRVAEPFTMFKTPAGGEVYVAAEQVATIQQVEHRNKSAGFN